MDQDTSMDTPVLKPAAPLLRASALKDIFFHFKHGNVDKFFVDKQLPRSAVTFVPDERFGTDYFTTLSALVAAPGPTWSAGTPNHLGGGLVGFL